MTRDEFDKMLEANQIVFVGEAAWRVAQLVAAAEREACAKLIDEQDSYGDPVYGWFRHLAAKIRARGQE